MKTPHFYTELPCQKPMLRQIEWGAQNGPTTKNRIPATIFFSKILFQLTNLV